MGTRRQQQVRILETLEEHGWERASIERNSHEWVDEIWSLRSTQAPAGFRAWLAFLVDPMWQGPRRPGEGVRAVAADVQRRQDHRDWLFEMPLGRRWERGLPELLEALSNARTASKLKTANSKGC